MLSKAFGGLVRGATALALGWASVAVTFDAIAQAPPAFDVSGSRGCERSEHGPSPLGLDGREHPDKSTSSEQAPP